MKYPLYATSANIFIKIEVFCSAKQEPAGAKQDILVTVPKSDRFSLALRLTFFCARNVGEG